MSKAPKRPMHQDPVAARAQWVAERQGHFDQTAKANAKAASADVKRFEESARDLKKLPPSPQRNLGTFGGDKPSLTRETTIADVAKWPR
jgi:hypothetical protein